MTAFRLLWTGSEVREIADGEPCVDCDDNFLWEHIELHDGEDSPFGDRKDLPDVVLNALIATETRPRCDQIGDGALVNLRGPAAEDSGQGDALVSIRAWIHRNLVLSVSRRQLAATTEVEAAMRSGRVTDAGDLVSAYAKAISGALDPQVAELGDMIDDCESEIEPGAIYSLRRRIAASRSQAIAYRRFIAPERDALATLASFPVDWLAEEDRLHIREAADRFARMAEELEAVRERAALLHEQITDLRAELIDQRSLMIAVVAFIFLPLTFITGLLGMNVEGIPFAHTHWAFWGVVAFCVLVGAIVFGWFARRHWLGK